MDQNSLCSGQDLGVPRREEASDLNWAFSGEEEIYRPAMCSWGRERASYGVHGEEEGGGG